MKRILLNHNPEETISVKDTKYSDGIIVHNKNGGFKGIVVYKDGMYCLICTDGSKSDKFYKLEQLISRFREDTFYQL